MLRECEENNFDHQLVGLRAIEKRNGMKIEEYHEVFDRVQLLKKQLREEVDLEVSKKAMQPHEKILVVSHCRVLENFFLE